MSEPRLTPIIQWCMKFAMAVEEQETEKSFSVRTLVTFVAWEVKLTDHFLRFYIIAVGLCPFGLISCPGLSLGLNVVKTTMQVLKEASKTRSVKPGSARLCTTAAEYPQAVKKQQRNNKEATASLELAVMQEHRLIAAKKRQLARCLNPVGASGKV